MSVFKCKMCGGTLEINNNETVAVCEYCGTKQTLPKSNDEVVSNLFNRANNLRLKCEFDKAEQVYEKILEVDNTEAEAHWGIVLCKYGIEYVEDPKTFKRIPTCHRTLFEAVTTDADYLAAIDYSDAAQKHIYESEARAIDRIQKDILAIVKNEKPFDVFICYKETDENGKRTIDSTIANDIYYQLTQEGFKVFFASITLEDKLGQEYEPYIFAALNSAKVMLVLGTKPEYYSAVWVKNEWSRFLQLMKSDRSKLLIPCYRDMDAYDLPEEFAHLQAQDMSKIGFINDVVRGIKKIAQADTPKTTVVKETVISGGNANTESLLKRAFMFLEDGDWNSADEYCEKVLDIDPECAEAYLGKLMVDLKVRKRADLGKQTDYFDENPNYHKALRFADAKLKTEFDKYVQEVDINIKEEIYVNAKEAYEKSKDSDELLEIAEFFKTISGYKDADFLSDACVEKAECVRKDEKYDSAVSIMKAAGNKKEEYEKAIEIFQSIPDWKDSQDKILRCQQRIDEITAQEEKKIKKKKKRKIIAALTVSVIAVAVAVALLFVTVIIPKQKFSDIVAISAGDYCTVGLKSDGTVVAVGDNDSGRCDVSDWTDIVAISAGGGHTVGLKSDGTVVAVGYNEYGQCDVSDWTDIVAISAGYYHTVGLKSDGTVVAVGYNEDGQCNVSDWTDIVAVSAGNDHTVGLKSDGTVVAVGDNRSGQCDVSDWKDIVEISAGAGHTVGLKSDGTIVAVGDNFYGQCDVSDWTDIVAISAGLGHTVGLKSDGTVVAVGKNTDGQCDVSDWTDIIAISVGYYHTVGLKSDGTVVAVGDNRSGQCLVGGKK